MDGSSAPRNTVCSKWRDCSSRTLYCFLNCFFSLASESFNRGENLGWWLLYSIISCKNCSFGRKREKNLMKILRNCWWCLCYVWSCPLKTENSEEKRKHNVKANLFIWCWSLWVLSYPEKGNLHPGPLQQLPLLKVKQDSGRMGHGWKQPLIEVENCLWWEVEENRWEKEFKKQRIRSFSRWNREELQN